MKQAAGWMLQPPPARGALPRRQWVYQTVLAAIREGALLAGARLPSARQMALEWRVTRGAVDEALAQLQSEGLIERRVGDGSYVSTTMPALPPQATVAARREPSATVLRVLERFEQLTASRVPRADPSLWRALRPAKPYLSSFPLATWKRLLSRATMGAADRAHLNYGHSLGLWALREATARHLRLTQAANASADQVIVVHSFLQGLELIVQVLLEAGDLVAIEDPGYLGIQHWLALARLRVAGVALDRQGLDVSDLRERAPDAAALIFNRANSYPSGIATDLARGEALLQWASERSAWIIETQHHRDFAHDGPPMPGLSLSDRAEQVITLGAYGAMAFPALRLAYVVVPPRFAKVFTALCGVLFEHPPVANQQALADFIDEGHASAHLRTLRALYRERRDALRAGVAAHAPEWARLEGDGCGVNALLPLPPGWSDVEVVKALDARGVGATALSAHSTRADAPQGLVLGYGGYDIAAIDAACRELGAVLRAYQPTGENK
jgi:GntR family transcriptional regulator / MocR family aminotransferase